MHSHMALRVPLFKAMLALLGRVPETDVAVRATTRLAAAERGRRGRVLLLTAVLQATLLQAATRRMLAERERTLLSRSRTTLGGSERRRARRQ